MKKYSLSVNKPQRHSKKTPSNPFSKKVFFDFTCILHSPLNISKLKCVGKVCREFPYTLYLHTKNGICPNISEIMQALISFCLFFNEGKVNSDHD